MTALRSYPKYKHSEVEWVGDIPESYKVVPFFTVLEEQKHKNNNMKEKNLLSLSYGNIIRKDINTNSGLLPENFEGYQIVHKGNILMRFTDLQNDKRSLRVGLVHETGIITSAYLGLCCKKEIVPQFAYYLLHSYDICKVYYNLGGGVRQSVKYEDIKRLPIVLPDVETQRLISIFLNIECGKIDALIEKSERMLALLDEKRQAVITHYVTKGANPNAKLKPSGIEWLGDIPEAWKLNKLRNLGYFQNGISAGSEYFGAGYPFVSYGDIYNNLQLPTAVEGMAQSSNEDRKKYSVEAGDVFFTRTSETIEEIGISSVCMETIKDAAFSGFVIRFRPTVNSVSKEFSKYYFRSSVTRRFFVKEMNLVTRASLGQDLLKLLPVLIPPLPEQREIAQILDKKIHDIEFLQSKITKQVELLKERKTSLITAAVTGKIDVRDYKKLQEAA